MTKTANISWELSIYKALCQFDLSYLMLRTILHFKNEKKKNEPQVVYVHFPRRYNQCGSKIHIQLYLIPISLQ